MFTGEREVVPKASNRETLYALGFSLRCSVLSRVFEKSFLFLKFFPVNAR